MAKEIGDNESLGSDKTLCIAHGQNVSIITFRGNRWKQDLDIQYCTPLGNFMGKSQAVDTRAVGSWTHSHGLDDRQLYVNAKYHSKLSKNMLYPSTSCP